MERVVGGLGVLVFIALAALMSSNRRRIDWRIVIVGTLLQVLVAYLVLSLGPVAAAFSALAAGVNRIIGAADAGIAFVFGNLGDPSGPWGLLFFARVLPVIIFFSALMAVLYHMGVMQRIIAALAWVLRGTLRVTGTEALVVAANIFVGQTEAPLCIRPYIEKMTRAQLMVVMVGGFATIAGSVLAAFVGMLGEQFTRHLLAASVMAAPAAFVMAKVIQPEVDDPVDGGVNTHWGDERAANVLDAAAAGTSDGLKLALNVAAMLIAFVALLKLINIGLAAVSDIPTLVGAQAWPAVTLESVLGVLLAPIGFLLGVPWNQADEVATLLGQKLILTEFVGYASLADMAAAEPPAVSLRTQTIATYALCGFANFPSIAIQIGGLSALAPSRRSDFATLGLRAMLGGALASCMTAAIAGQFIPG